MNPLRALFGLTTLVLFAYACSDSSDPGARVAAALDRAQCDVKLFRVDSETCRASFDTCRASNALGPCRDAYVACLPAFPTSADHGGEGRGGDDRGEVRGRSRGGAPEVSSGALASCSAARGACLTATEDPSGCGATAVECVKRALHDAFVATCTDAKTHCADGDFTDTACATITTRCDQGESPASIPDNQCAAPAAPAAQPVRTDAAPTPADAGDAATAVDAAPDSPPTPADAAIDAQPDASDGG